MGNIFTSKTYSINRHQMSTCIFLETDSEIMAPPETYITDIHARRVLLVKCNYAQGLDLRWYSLHARSMRVVHFSKPAQKSSEFPSNKTTHESVCLIFQKEFSATQNSNIYRLACLWKRIIVMTITSTKLSVVKKAVYCVNMLINGRGMYTHTVVVWFRECFFFTGMWIRS